MPVDLTYRICIAMSLDTFDAEARGRTVAAAAENDAIHQFAVGANYRRIAKTLNTLIYEDAQSG